MLFKIFDQLNMGNWKSFLHTEHTLRPPSISNDLTWHKRSISHPFRSNDLV